MRSSSREEVVETFDALDADLTRALELSFDTLTTPERLNLLERIETLRRRLPALERPLIDELTHADPEQLGGKLRWALADRLRITRAEAKRRIDETADLGKRRRFDGQPQPPLLPHTAAAAAAGRINAAHIHIIRDFWHHLPNDVHPELAANAEKHLANLACQYRPDELAKLAACLADCLNPDGLFSDVDRARRRSLTLSRQDTDGMSTLTATLTPQARAALDAVLARWAAPGMANPADTTPCLDGTPNQAAIDNDDRTTSQRNHDALAALTTAMLASGKLGTHNGLPATIVVTTTLAELEAPARTALSGGAKAHTGGGTWLPMSDVLKLATQAHHYLAIFDGAKPLALYHANGTGARSGDSVGVMPLRRLC
ncbi:13E12 repeat family protein [Mycolicibacillus trivialis]|uniref:DUF222 domain-containing protein n=1 Tax=Mycolicibacillus trivialis TaxID=1798 RepID=A0A1X2EGE1_9MYCO|nr:13E12 repeat family protein [Mycolicibacillus trivialis]ORX01136.1 hypothetical protein AWC30_14815 [Mycolicibacillus trivialis]